MRLLLTLLVVPIAAMAQPVKLENERIYTATFEQMAWFDSALVVNDPQLIELGNCLAANHEDTASVALKLVEQEKHVILERDHRDYDDVAAAACGPQPIQLRFVELDRALHQPSDVEISLFRHHVFVVGEAPPP